MINLRTWLLATDVYLKATFCRYVPYTSASPRIINFHQCCLILSIKPGLQAMYGPTVALTMKNAPAVSVEETSLPVWSCNKVANTPKPVSIRDNACPVTKININFLQYVYEKHINKCRAWLYLLYCIVGTLTQHCTATYCTFIITYLRSNGENKTKNFD